MEKHPLLMMIEDFFFDGVKADAAEGLGFSPSNYSHYAYLNRRLREDHLVHIRKTFGKAHGVLGGLTDSQILDALEERWKK